MTSFRAFRIFQQGNGVRAESTRMAVSDLSPGDVLIRARWSGINFKDALAATGTGRILRRFPLNGGIDVAGTVESSGDRRFSPGDEVLVTGNGLGEYHDGGYAEYIRVPGDWVILLPAGLSLRDSMCLGTAGFAAALAIHQMQRMGQNPSAGPVAVTGATGGVGSLAVDMLAGLGFQVHAVTGKAQQAEYLRRIGAAEVLIREQLDPGKRPLESVAFAGAIDNLGGDWLAWLTRVTGNFGNIASVGLAASPKLDTTVMPFILRGINLLGVNTVETPRPIREQIWQRLATDLKPRHLDLITVRDIELSELGEAFPAYLRGGVVGRTLVRID